jgi:hypothetical protein
VEHGPRRDRGVVPATSTLPQQTSRQFQGLALLALWALEALGPSAPRKVQPTGGLVAKEHSKLVQ